jgi:hypothetical protein
VSAASTEGYARGVRAGDEDQRRGRPFNVSNDSDYRRGDVGYRKEYGNRDRYRDEFRRAFAQGYSEGYRRNDYGRDNRQPYGRGGYNDPWNQGPGRGQGPVANTRYDLAFQAGLNDGYEAGLDDGHDGRRFDPVGERRYRSADRGYDRRYGSKDAWKVRYRDGFKLGYEEGYQDARRYTRGYDPRNDRRSDRPWWWPFLTGR